MGELASQSRPTLLWCGPESALDRVESALADVPVDVRGCEGVPEVVELARSGNAVGVLIHTDRIAADADAWRAASRLLEERGIPWLALVADGAERPGRAESTEPEEPTGAGGHGDVGIGSLAPVLALWLRPLIDLAESRHELGELRQSVAWLRDFQQLGSCLEAGQLHPLALELLLRASGRDLGLAVFLRDGPGKGLATAFRGIDEAEAEVLSNCLADEKPLDLAVIEGLGVIESGPVHEAMRAAGLDVGEMLQIPIEGHAGPIGVLCVPAGDRPIGELDLSAAELLLEHMRMAVRNAETYLQAKERAFIDDVTELYNARYLIQTADNEIQRADRYGNPLSVLFLDLDRFKRVNDEWGHLIGSDTLRRLAGLLSTCVRQVDTLARYGGDEFTILLVDTDHNAAVHVAERIRRSVEEHIFEMGGDARLRLTVSVGVATCPDHATAREALLDAADKAMYRAKSDGRNRVCSAHELFDA